MNLKLLYILIEVEDMFNMEVVRGDDGDTLTFTDKDEAEEYAERHCCDARVVGVEE